MKNRMLYERCWLCRGTLITTAPAMVDGPGCRGRLAVGSPCPGCEESKTPGWMETGITADQVEAIIQERDRLRAELIELHRGTT